MPRIFDGEAPLPCYAKPDIGSGSRGGFLVETAQDLDLARRRSLLVHELLPGPEYTVDCLSGLDGGLMFANVRVRGQVARGISVGTTGLRHADIEDSVRRIAARTPLRGPWFAQFKEARDGTPTLLEVNARVSGSMTLTRLSGDDLAFRSWHNRGVRTPSVPDHCEDNAHLYYLILPSAEQRAALIAACKADGIMTPFHYVPLHDSPAGRRLGRACGELAVTEDLAARLVRLPLFPCMGDALSRVIERVQRHLDRLL